MTERSRERPSGRGRSGRRTRIETSSGGVVYRPFDTGPAVLLIRDPYNNWGLPKGHIESGESSEEAAVRETLEEAGVTARIVEFLTTARQVVRGAPQWVDYYLMAMETEGEGEEGRRVAWLAEEAAIRRITYEQSRAVLAQACARLGQITGSLR